MPPVDTLDPQAELIRRWLPLGIMVLFLVRGAAEFATTYSLGWIGRQVIKSVRALVFDKFLHLPTRYYDAASTGTLLSKLTFNIEQMADAASNVVTVLIRDSLTAIGLVAYMVYLSPPLSAFVFVAAPLLAVLIRVLSRMFRRYSTPDPGVHGRAHPDHGRDPAEPSRHQDLQWPGLRAAPVRGGQRAEPAHEHAPVRHPRGGRWRHGPAGRGRHGGHRLRRQPGLRPGRPGHRRFRRLHHRAAAADAPVAGADGRQRVPAAGDCGGGERLPVAGRGRRAGHGHAGAGAPAGQGGVPRRQLRVRGREGPRAPEHQPAGAGGADCGHRRQVGQRQDHAGRSAAAVL